jgi:four helix bundle protein
LKYDEWEQQIHQAIRADRLWNLRVYRLALFASDLGWRDVNKILHDRRVNSLADQLYRSIGSISANIAEGFSRSTGKDRARFYEYALGSARESRDWYYKARNILSDKVSDHRIELLTEIIRMLLVIVPEQRRSSIKETDEDYVVKLNLDSYEL